jgi:N-hydroxyarylamine O-acetyltransferase
MLDLNAYLRRIEYAGRLEPTLPVLEALHRAHTTHIPFENLDILLGRSIQLDLESLQAKLVTGCRGGYCFEHNLLFATVLQELGFSVVRLAARVNHGDRVLPRTHMMLIVDVDGSRWLADVGFGMEGLLAPVPFGTGEESRQSHWTYRVAERGGLWTLQSLHGQEWIDLYDFTLEPQHQIDYEMANYFTSTHPSSRFVQTLTAQYTRPEVRMALRNRELIVDKGAGPSRRVLADDEELLDVLATTFGLRFPPGTRFNYNDPR